MVHRKHILIVGMARSGIEAARLALAKGLRISLYDAKPRATFTDCDDVLSEAEHLLFGDVRPDVALFDMLVLSPGVPTTLPFIVEAVRDGVEVIGEIAFAGRYARGRTLGITGTNGKTTTTALTTELFIAAGYHAVACGNIGLPFSQAVREGDSADVIYILELSSYQLESIADFTVDCAAILNITPDHLARHKTMAAYTAAKLNIANALRQSNRLLLNRDDARVADLTNAFKAASTFSKSAPDALVHVVDDHIVVDDGTTRPVIAVDQLIIRGEHNLENALAATGLAYLMGVELTSIAKGLKRFKGVSHRHEWVLSCNDIDVYNDSKATNPEATIPALKTIDKPTVLIVGGMDKGSDYQVMFKHFQLIVHVVLLGETKHDIATALEMNGIVTYTLVDTMEEAVAAAIRHVPSPGNILLSPACASWDMYANFEVRGDHFKTCIKEQMDRLCKSQQ